MSAENVSYDLKRFAGIKRDYTDEEVERLRGSIKIEYSLCKQQSEKLWKLLNTEPYVNTLGSLSANESSIASGFSNETFIFSLEENDEIKNFVLRLKPTNYQVFPEYNLKLQVDIMRCLHDRGFPAPNVILYESNEDILGSEFYLMDYKIGRAHV